MTDPDVDPSDAGLASRTAAWRALRRVHRDDAWSVQAVDGVLRRSGLGARDRSFAANLAYSTLRWEGTLDWALGTVVDRPLDRVQPELLDVLRLGAWQVLYGSTPARAAVTTAVELARAEVGPQATGFVNGVLRALARDSDRLPWPPDDDDAGLGLRTGYPPWVVAAARAQFGQRAREVLEAGNRPAGITLRAIGDRDALVAQLRAAGADALPGVLAQSVRVADVASLGPIGELPAVAGGHAVVQDEASMAVVLAAAAGRTAPGWRAADLCAAPGGKSTFLAQLGAEVFASDVQPRRAELVAEAARRSRLGVHTVVADATRPPYATASFDVVLLDAPCTGLGVVRRRPELRWRRRDGDAARLGQLQQRLLEAAAELVRPGGVLVYSVCTWTEAETTGVVRPFLALNADRYSPDEVDTGGLGARLRPDDPGVVLDPARDATDGMYIARFRRR